MASLAKELKYHKTHKKIKDISLHLFLENGFDDTSINDIVKDAGCSLGTFYKHFKGKEILFIEIWDEYVSGHTRQMITFAPKDPSGEEMVDYIIKKAYDYGHNEITIKLYPISQKLAISYNYPLLHIWAGQATELMLNYIRKSCPGMSLTRANTIANIWRCLIDNYAMSFVWLKNPRYSFYTEELKECLLKLLEF